MRLRRAHLRRSSPNKIIIVFQFIYSEASSKAVVPHFMYETYDIRRYTSYIWNALHSYGWTNSQHIAKNSDMYYCHHYILNGVNLILNCVAKNFITAISLSIRVN